MQNTNNEEIFIIYYWQSVKMLTRISNLSNIFILLRLCGGGHIRNPCAKTKGNHYIVTSKNGSNFFIDLLYQLKSNHGHQLRGCFEVKTTVNSDENKLSAAYRPHCLLWIRKNGKILCHLSLSLLPLENFFEFKSDLFLFIVRLAFISVYIFVFNLYIYIYIYIYINIYIYIYIYIYVCVCVCVCVCVNIFLYIYIYIYIYIYYI